MSTPSPKLLFVFLLRFGLAYGALLASWGWLHAVLGTLFRDGTGVGLDLLGLGEYVELRPLNGGEPGADTVLFIDRSECTIWWFAYLDSWLVWFLPNAAFLALAAGAPKRFAKRIGAFALGGFVVQVFVVARVATTLLRGMIEHLPQCQGAHPWIVGNAVGRRAILVMDGLLMEPLLNMAVPVVVWLFLVTRPWNRSDVAES